MEGRSQSSMDLEFGVWARLYNIYCMVEVILFY
jgi:hypothetical protein